MFEIKKREKFVITACTVLGSWLERVGEVAARAASGEVVLLRRAGSSEGSFEIEKYQGKGFCQAGESIGRGAGRGNHYIRGRKATS